MMSFHLSLQPMFTCTWSILELNPYLIGWLLVYFTHVTLYSFIKTNERLLKTLLDCFIWFSHCNCWEYQCVCKHSFWIWLLPLPLSRSCQAGSRPFTKLIFRPKTVSLRPKNKILFDFQGLLAVHSESAITQATFFLFFTFFLFVCLATVKEWNHYSIVNEIKEYLVYRTCQIQLYLEYTARLTQFLFS